MGIELNELPSMIRHLKGRNKFLEIALGKALSELGRAIELTRLEIESQDVKVWNTTEDVITGSVFLISKRK